MILTALNTFSVTGVLKRSIEYGILIADLYIIQPSVGALASIQITISLILLLLLMKPKKIPSKRYKHTLAFLQKNVPAPATILDLGVRNPFSEIM